VLRRWVTDSTWESVLRARSVDRLRCLGVPLVLLPPPSPTSLNPPPPPPPPPPQPLPPTSPAAVVVVVVGRWISTIGHMSIGDDGGPARSSWIRTRTTVAEVTEWRFTFSSWDPPNFLIRWETHRKRITAVSPTSWSSTDCNTTTVRLESNPTTPTPADCIACTTSKGDIEEWICRT
jgi:hypothetical protein